MLRLLRFALALVLLVAAAAVGLVLVGALDRRQPPLAAIRGYQSLRSTRLLDRHGLLVGELGTARHTPVPREKLAPPLLEAATAYDPGFLDGNGLHFPGLVKGLGRALVPGARLPSLAPDLARQLLPGERGFGGRLLQLGLAARLLWSEPRAKLVELYLNHGDFGARRFGVEEAARYYFDRPAAALDLGQAALLVGLLHRRGEVDPRRHVEETRGLACALLGALARAGRLGAEEGSRLCRALPEPAAEPRPRLAFAPELVERAREKLAREHGGRPVDELGLELRSSADLALQTLVWERLQRHLEDLDAGEGRGLAEGHVEGTAKGRHLAGLRARLAGGLGPAQTVLGVVERVERDPRAPAAGRIVVDVGAGVGVVELAQEARLQAAGGATLDRVRPGDLVAVRAAPERAPPGTGDAPVELPLALAGGVQAAVVALAPATRQVLALVAGYDYRPGTVDRALRRRPLGRMVDPFVWATALHRRAATAVALRPLAREGRPPRGGVWDEIPEDAVRDLAGRCGLADAGPTAAERGDPLRASSPLDLANAYATLVAGGHAGIPSWFLAAAPPSTPRSTSTSGAASVSTTPPLVEPPVAFLTASLLDTALREGPLARAGLALPPRGGAVWAPEILGHADVTADRRDAWFVLATTEIVLVVWVGHDDGRPLGRALDRGNPAVTLGAALMDGALGGRAIEPLPRPPGLVVAPIDPRTGRYVEGEGASVPEIFLGGTQPKPLPEEDAPAAAASAPIDAE